MPLRHPIPEREIHSALSLSVGYLIWMALVVIHWLKRGFVKIALEEKSKLLPPSQGNMLFSKRAYRP